MSPFAFLIIQIVAVAVPVGAGVAVALAPARRGAPVGVGALLRAGVVLFAAAAACTFVAPAFGTSAFGMIRILYLAGVVALPLVALAVLGARAAKRITATRPAIALAAAAFLAAPLGFHMTFIEPFKLRVETATLVVANDRAGSAPVTFGVFADLQCDSVGDHERAAVDLLMAQRPDVILIPGDLFQGSRTEWGAARDALRDLLRKLDAPGGVFFVVGDVDPDDVAELMREADIRVLDDEVVRIRVRDREVTIGGVSNRDEAVVRELERAPGAGDVRVLLCHRPDHVLGLAPDTRIDLTVAGHTHGGQIVVPGFGPPMTLSRVPRDVAAGGLHRMDGRAIYVSRGIGVEHNQAPRMRFNCVPEVSVVTVTGGGAERP